MNKIKKSTRFFLAHTKRKVQKHTARQQICIYIQYTYYIYSSYNEMQIGTLSIYQRNNLEKVFVFIELWKKNKNIYAIFKTDWKSKRSIDISLYYDWQNAHIRVTGWFCI